jgi:hypothetical protein
MYDKIFEKSSTDVHTEDNRKYMDIFATSPKASETSPPPGKYDLFGNEPKKPVDIFAGIAEKQAVGRALRVQTVEPVVVSVVNAQSTFDVNYHTREEIEKEFKKFATDNEAYTNTLIDVSQEMQKEHDRIEKKYAELSKLAENIKAALVPQKTWLGKIVPVDKNAVHQLIDTAQIATKEPFKIDVFLMANLTGALQKSRECGRVIKHLEDDFNHMLKHSGKDASDPLYQRIVTTRKMIELQNLSTEKTLSLLQQSYDKIEEFRRNSLIIVLIDAQTKLIN